jgi:hypothetical protein
MVVPLEDGRLVDIDPLPFPFPDIDPLPCPLPVLLDFELVDGEGDDSNDGENDGGGTVLKVG